ncbi:hypothetical protein TWF718_003073 [Orbilia javanica]|uniref:Uncharacterized protein n=1 Tax=Orbilia javanica TaxID=47235 RepID=A0AAN8RJB7_9PEZI
MGRRPFYKLHRHKWKIAIKFSSGFWQRKSFRWAVAARWRSWTRTVEVKNFQAFRSHMRREVQDSTNFKQFYIFRDNQPFNSNLQDLKKFQEGAMERTGFDQTIIL